MVLMRDKGTGKVREVSERWLKRWPDDYEPIEAPKSKGRKRPEQAAAAETNETGGETEGEASWRGK
jgi:hypothetical protein